MKCLSNDEYNVDTDESHQTQMCCAHLSFENEIVASAFSNLLSHHFEGYKYTE